MKDQKGLTNVHFYQDNAEMTHFESASFDLIQYSYVLHEMPAANCERVIKEAMRLLKPGGVLSGFEGETTLMQWICCLSPWAEGVPVCMRCTLSYFSYYWSTPCGTLKRLGRLLVHRHWENDIIKSCPSTLYWNQKLIYTRFIYIGARAYMVQWFEWQTQDLRVWCLFPATNYLYKCLGNFPFRTALVCQAVTKQNMVCVEKVLNCP